jgi:hypothetical protein
MDVAAPGALGKRRLTIGFSPRQKAQWVTVWILALCATYPVAGLAAFMTYLMTKEVNATELTPTAVAAGWVVGLAYVVFVIVMILNTVRSGFRLDGTVVIQRKAITTRRVDLATAEVAGDRVATPVRVGENAWGEIVSAAVRARDPRTGVAILIPVRTPGRGRLPSDELTAIADAIMVRRQPTDPGYPQAQALAQELRRMAASPFPI